MSGPLAGSPRFAAQAGERLKPIISMPLGWTRKALGALRLPFAKMLQARDEWKRIVAVQK
jgi:hypothetical protein